MSELDQIQLVKCGKCGEVVGKTIIKRNENGVTLETNCDFFHICKEVQP